jgi:hypothetical protein
MRDDVKRLIEDGYDAMADRFAAWQREIEVSIAPDGEARFQWLLARKPE